MTKLKKIHLANKDRTINLHLNVESDRRARKIWEKHPEPIYPSTVQIWKFLVEKYSWDAILDIGANYGELAALAFLHRQSISSPIYLFEPALTLREPLHLTFGYKEQVFLEFVGLSDRDGHATFRNFREDSGKSNLQLIDEKMEKPSVNRDTIEIRRLDSYGLSATRLLIKIDIEGHEPEALRGAIETLENTAEVVILMEANQVDFNNLSWIRKDFEIWALSRLRGRLIKVNWVNQNRKGRVLSSLYFHDIVLIKTNLPDAYARAFIPIPARISKVLRYSFNLLK